MEDAAIKRATQVFARLGPEQSVGQALDALGSQALESAIVYFYVVDSGNRLLGVVPTRRLLTAARQAPVASLVTRASVTLPLQGTLSEAATLLRKHRLLAVPIVDDE